MSEAVTDVLVERGDRDVVRSVATEKTYPKNAVVLTEGEMGDSLYMIQSGKVKVFIGDEDGREIILKILGPGDFFAKSEGPKLAHQFVNDGEADLRILSIGKHREDDAIEYPTPPWVPGGHVARGETG